MTDKTTDNKPANVLWTGGWDSTFRVIQLARAGRTIQPYYVINTNRESTNNEIATMAEIRGMLTAKYPECTIHPVKYVDLSSVYPKTEYVDAYERLAAQSYIGSQYSYLSALAAEVDGLELCIHEDDKAEFFIKKLHEENTDDKDIHLIFGKLSYPILEYTKIKMREEAEQNGEVDILNKTWFCHCPINRRACGICNPCKYSLEEGMGYRFTKRAKLYSKAPRLIKFLQRVARHFF